MAIVAGLFLTLPGFFALLHAQAAVAPLDAWVVRDLLIAALAGVALVLWGGAVIRQRELKMHDLEEARRWLRVQR